MEANKHLISLLPKINWEYSFDENEFDISIFDHDIKLFFTSLQKDKIIDIYDIDSFLDENNQAWPAYVSYITTELTRYLQIHISITNVILKCR